MADDTLTVLDGNGASKTIWVDNTAKGIAQVVKVAFGADDTGTMVSSSDPMPVTLASLPALATGSNTIGTVVLGAGSAAVGTVVLGTGSASVGTVVLGAGSASVGTVINGAGESHIGEVGGKGATVSAEFTRPSDTTAYAAGDVVSNSTSSTTLLSISGCTRVNAGSGYIVGCQVTTDKKSITPRFRVHLFNASNPTMSADNAAHQEKYADAGKRLGFFDMPAMITPADTTNSDMSRSINQSLRHFFTCAASSTTLYVLLETLDAFTPASGEKFTVALSIDQN